MSIARRNQHSPPAPLSRTGASLQPARPRGSDRLLNRRQLLAVVSATAAAALAQPLASAAPTTAGAVDLSSPSSDDRICQYQVKVDSTGELKLNADGQKVARRAVQVEASFRFDERWIDGGDENAPRLRVRGYDEAEARIRVGATRFTSELKESRRLTAVRAEQEQLVLFSPAGPLTRDELDLIDVPGTVGSLTELMPDQPVAIDARWTWSPETLARLLRLEAVTDAKVEARLVAVEKSVALIEAEGHVSGAVGGVATEIDVAAKLNFDLNARLVNWLALGLKENRAIGHAEPGFETTTQIKITVRTAAQSERLAPEVLAAAPLEYGPGSSLLLYDSAKAHYRLLLDRRWRSMVDREDLTVLRFVDRGDLVAQCNVSPLPQLAPGKQLSLEEFQDDIKQSLAKTFRQFAEASQTTTDDGLRVLRVAAVGESNGLAVQWNYYHVSNEAGRRLAMVFTFEGTLYDRFAENDRSVVSSVQFLTQPEPTKAKTASESRSPLRGPTR